MTKASRKVLEDCKGALEDFKYGVQGGEWRRRWITSVVLLRTVGNVLKIVDALTDPVLEKIINAEWEKLKGSKPEPRIFWEFIYQERNNILKEYQISANMYFPFLECPLKLSGFFSINLCGVLLYPNIACRYSIEWWDKYLANIETQYAANKRRNCDFELKNGSGFCLQGLISGARLATVDFLVA